MNKPLVNCLILAIVMTGAVQLIQAQKADPQLVEKLVNVSSSGHTFRRGLPEWIKPPTPEHARVAARLDPVVAELTELTPDQKLFIKSNYENIAQLMNGKMVAVLVQHAKFNDWLTAYLTETYSKELTPVEVKEWIAYFETPEAKRTLKALFAIPQPTDAESLALFDKLEKTPLGAKYLKIIGNDLNTVIQAKLAEIEPTVKGEFDRMLAAGELKKVVVQFVAENYKKP